jgi:hypothetical protein
MAATKDMIGKRFGLLTVLEKAEQRNSRGLNCYICQCDCGNKVTVCGRDMTRGHTQSCGCLRKNIAHNRLVKHNGCGSRLYSIWKSMNSRCNNENTNYYKHYGGKGVKICDSWKDYAVFKEWALANGYNDNLTLDRIDFNGDYCPENCRWLTMKEQSNNRSSNHRITYKGMTKTISEWAEYFGLSYGAMSSRVYSGWSMERIEYTPPRKARIKHITR